MAEVPRSTQREGRMSDVELPSPPQRRRTWKTRAVVIAAVAGLLVGAGIGASAKEVAPATPAETVTLTEEVTPPACLEALDLADQGFTYAGEAMGAASDGFEAGSRFDIAGIEAATERISQAGDKIEAITADYQAAKAACRASG
jgi:hypothetical protein